MPMHDPELWANMLIFLTILMASLADWDLEVFNSDDVVQPTTPGISAPEEIEVRDFDDESVADRRFGGSAVACVTGAEGLSVDVSVLLRYDRLTAGSDVRLGQSRSVQGQGFTSDAAV